MAYGVEAYLIDLSIITTLIGSHNIDCERAILQAMSDTFDVLDRSFDIESGAIDSRAILNEFLKNEFSGNTYSAIYGYVFKTFCQVYGDFLPNRAWCPCLFGHLCSITVASDTLPIKFPYPDDFPTIKYIDYRKLNDDLYNFVGLLEDQNQEINQWLKMARNSSKDIFLFYH